MNNIVLVISLLLAFVTGSFITLKAVQLKLKWEIQTKEGKEPELNTPITQIKETIDNKKLEEVQQYRKDQLNEWMFGK